MTEPATLGNGRSEMSSGVDEPGSHGLSVPIRFSVMSTDNEPAVEEDDPSRPAEAHGTIELVSDGEDLLVLGVEADVDRFLGDIDLLASSSGVSLSRFGATVATTARVAQTGSIALGESGRYLKLTKESAARMKQIGLMPTDLPGIDHVMLGPRGGIKGWLQVEGGAGSLLTNPAVLSGIAGIVAQVGEQALVNEFRERFDVLDEKLDDVRRSQRDAKLADLYGAADSIEEATDIWDAVGFVDGVAWSKVQQIPHVIKVVQQSAVTELRALADRVGNVQKVRKFGSTVKDAQGEIFLWLNVIAYSFGIDAEMTALEVNHRMNSDPEKFDHYRDGLRESKRRQRTAVQEAAMNELQRIFVAARLADGRVLLHPRSASSAASVLNEVGSAARPLLQTPDATDALGTLQVTRWRDAAKKGDQWKNAGAEVGPVVAKGVAASVALVVTAVVKDRLGGTDYDDNV